MKFLQRMLSHGLLIAIVVVAGLAYWYRAELFPEQFGHDESRTVAGKPVTGSGADRDTASATTADSGVEAPAAVPDESAEAEASTGEPASSAAQADDQPPVSEPEAEDAQSAAPDAVPLSWESDEPLTTASPGGAPEFRPLETDREAPPPLPAETETAMAPQTSSPTMSSAPAEAGSADPGQGLAAAREAFWRNDFAAAERHYRSVIEQQPDNPDVYGELGNLHYQQGQWQQAAEAYFQAAQRLLDRGDRMPAQHLLRILRNLDPERARELESRMSETMSSG